MREGMAAQSQPVTAQTSLATSDAAPSAAFTPPAALSLYFSTWRPRGVRLEWDKCSMDLRTSATLIGNWGRNCGELIEVVAWFTDDGDMRVLVADYDSGRRLIVRCGRSGWKISYERHGRALQNAPKPEVAAQPSHPGEFRADLSKPTGQ